MGVVLVCGALLLAALVAAVRWRGLPFVAPPPAAALPAGEVARRFAWYSAVLVVASVPAGLAVIGAGGRLAMRLLAVTADDAAQGRITEADEVVGEITVDGSIGFVVFNGIFGGLVTGALYLVLRRILPGGWVGGIVYGLALLVLLGTTVDPLHEDNPDFDIVGPGWVAVLVFAALAVAYGLVLVAFVNRASAWFPPLSVDRRVLVRYLAPAVIAAIAFSVTAFLGIVCLLVMAITRWRPVGEAVRSPRFVVAGRVLLGVLVLVSVPGAISAIADIAAR